MTIGILALQGAFIEHKKMLEQLGATCKEVRQLADLESIDGIVLPGGESTVQGQLLHKLGIYEPLRQKIQQGLPVLATCAGLILLAEQIEGQDNSHLATLPVTVRRNAYGRQLGSFNTTATVGDIGDYPMIFIRAPYIQKVKPGVEILATVDNHIVGVKYNNQLAFAFHPELSSDSRIHEEFLELVKSYK